MLSPRWCGDLVLGLAVTSAALAVTAASLILIAAVTAAALTPTARHF